MKILPQAALPRDRRRSPQPVERQDRGPRRSTSATRDGSAGSRTVYATTGDFAAIDAPWRELHARDGAATFFSSPVWLSAWWAHHGGGRRPLLVTAVQDGTLVGIAPFMWHRHYGVPVVRFVGTGLSDYGGVVVDDALPRRDIVYGLLDRLRATMPHAVLDMWEVSEGDPLLEIVTEWVRDRGERMRTFVTAVCPYLDLSADLAAHARALSTSVKRDERRNLRRLAELGTLELSDDLTHERDLAEVVDELAALEDLHPRAVERANPWRAPASLFPEAVLRATAGTGQVWLQGIRVNSQLIAYSVAFRHRATLYGYLQGFRADYARYGPGRLLQLHIQRSAIAAGITRFDLLRGAEPHKQGWTDLGSTNRRIVVWPRSGSPDTALRVLAARLRVAGRAQLREVDAVRSIYHRVRNPLVRNRKDPRGT
jgi:CelD/BcsL family acetyltransferase involved in cellulose biosynthesis